MGILSKGKIQIVSFVVRSQEFGDFWQRLGRVLLPSSLSLSCSLNDADTCMARLRSVSFVYYSSCPLVSFAQFRLTEIRGHDDAIALLWALHSPEIDLVGISTVHGNASLDNTSRTSRNFALSSVSATKSSLF